jgi:prefoldin subunit 5
MELQMTEEIKTARELATHANDIKHLQSDMDKMVEDVEEIKQAIQSIQKTLSEAKGGWKALIWAGGAISAITGFVGFISGYLGGK